MTEKEVRNKRKGHSYPPHWYKIIIEECVYCGSGGETRVRMYTPKPEKPEDRYEYIQYVDGWHFC